MVCLAIFLRRRRSSDPALALQGTGRAAAVGDFLSFAWAADPQCMVLPVLCPEHWRGQERTASGSMAHELC